MNLQSSIKWNGDHLEGLVLPNGWTISRKLISGGTGGNFSISYAVTRGTEGRLQEAFLKVLNLRRALEADDPLREIQRLTTAFVFEKDILAMCKDKRLRRIATILEDGQVHVPNCSFPVFYMIFELASADVRKHLSATNELDEAWTLRALHSVAVGLHQLHTNGIAHQDLKPSNVLIFEALGAKIGDLGSADLSSEGSPRGHLTCAGDPTYAPPELLYSELHPDWRTRRLGCDLYLFGSLALFLFTGGASMTSLIMGHLSPAHRYMSWVHDYRLVLPYVRDAFERAIEETKANIPLMCRVEIINMIRNVCDPDPRIRNASLGSVIDRHSLQAVISKLDVLATRSEYQLLRKP
jgi:eukaryotic-like serine/threonine-protein kinase